MSSDRYELGDRLGVGNSTIGVYEARHLDMDRKVAVKLLVVDRFKDRSALLAEARSMASLDRHENVVQVLDAGDWDEDHVYVATELCLGGSMESVASGSRVDPATACRYVSDVCRGLEFMHQSGLLHLDIRPANILFLDGVPKLCDFGLARWIHDSSVSMVYAKHAAPELRRQAIGTVLSDQYAMAMTLGHLITNGSICERPPQGQVSQRNWKGWPQMTELGVNVPKRLRRVIGKATSFTPADRYVGIEAFKRAVDNATPACSFKLVDPMTLESTDQVWRIQVKATNGMYGVQVLRNGRRVNKLGAVDLSREGADRHVAAQVNALA